MKEKTMQEQLFPLKPPVDLHSNDLQRFENIIFWETDKEWNCRAQPTL